MITKFTFTGAHIYLRWIVRYIFLMRSVFIKKLTVLRMLIGSGCPKWCWGSSTLPFVFVYPAFRNNGSSTTGTSRIYYVYARLSTTHVKTDRIRFVLQPFQYARGKRSNCISKRRSFTFIAVVTNT